MKCTNCGGELNISGDTFLCPWCGRSGNVATLAKEERIRLEKARIAKEKSVQPAFNAPEPMPEKSALSNDAVKELSGSDIYKRYRDAVVCVKSEIRQNGKITRMLGTAYFISYSGLLSTCAHVVKGAVSGGVYAEIGGRDIPCEILAKGDEKGIDLAVLKPVSDPDKIYPVILGNSSDIMPGDDLYVMGNSLGRGIAITKGILSDKRNGLLMYDCATNAGNSGGPVFNSLGQVVGTHTSGQTENGEKVQGMNYATPSDTLIKFIKQNNIKL